jgi:hypothetical protein
MRGLFIPVLVAANWGVLKLDNYTFPMLVGKDMPAFVRFDREYPYGDKAEAFNGVAAEIARTGVGCLMVSVGVSTWGDRMNNDLLVQQGYIDAEKELSYDDMDKMFPKFRFFPPNGGKPIDYDSDKVVIEEIMKFLRTAAGIEFALPGCVKVLDEIAKTALKAPKAALEKIQTTLADLNEFEKEKAAYYIKALEKETTTSGHIEKEKARLEGLLGGSLPQKNKDAMTLKINVLSSFFEL